MQQQTWHKNMTCKSGKKHAFLIAGTHSGCGKTTITLGLIAALKARGLRIQPFKAGPDFIDPGLHAKIAGAPSRNLDGWMLGRNYNIDLFRRLMAESEIGLVEGVMGLFDGYEGGTESGSSAELAKWLDIPAVLVVDARSMARSAAALIYGFKNFDPALNLCGVIFNRVGGRAHLEYLKEAVCPNFPGLAVLGGLPREEAVQIPERHLGLVTADEMALDRQWQAKLAGMVEEFLDLGLLLDITAYEAEGDKSKTMEAPRPEAVLTLSGTAGVSGTAGGAAEPPRPIIAVARDAAFCFYYPDNLELLENSGATLQFFSPAASQAVPGGCSGVYLGGGYPELFAEAISQNSAFLESLREAAQQGMPIYAECGGLMTLGRFIDTMDGIKFPMAGVLPFGTRMLARRRALGYTEVVLRKPCLLGEPGMRIRGHEFHYSEIVDLDEDDPGLELAYELRARKFERIREEGYMPRQVSSGGRRQSGKPAPQVTQSGEPVPHVIQAGATAPQILQNGKPPLRVLASYIHLHFGSAPEAARNFVDRCAEWKDPR